LSIYSGKLFPFHPFSIRFSTAVIETAIGGEAAYIVTRDDDIKLDERVSGFLSTHGISVLSVARFLALIDTCHADNPA